MTLFGLSALLTGITSTSIGIFVYLNGKNKRLNKIWLGITSCSALWGFGSLIATQESNYDLSMFWWKITYIGVISVPTVFFHFICVLLDYKRKLFIRFLYILTAIFLIINLFFENLFLKNIHLAYGNLYWWGPPGVIHNIFYVAFYLLLTTYSFFLMFKKFKTSSGFKRTQIIYFMVGSAIGWIGSEGCFLTGWNINIYPVFNFMIAVYPIILGYAMLRHNLLEIQIIIKKTLIYSISISILSICYFIGIYTLEKVFSTLIGYRSMPLAIIMIIFFSMLFIPLKNKIQIFIDKNFFHGSIDQIDKENILLREEIQKSEKMKAVATLAAGMAHEIKNPLTSIKTFTEYIKTKQNDPDFIDKFQQIVGSEVDKIDSIVKQLLEFSKPQELHLKETDINSLLDETLSLLNNDFLKHAIRVEKFYSPISPIKVDPVQIKQVFLNLLLNAIDTIDKDGKITISTETTNNDQICITIEDTGKGISKEDLKHIFDPFFTKKDSGTGLGLSIVHGIIEKHAGKIEVNSKIDNGSTFKILI